MSIHEAALVWVPIAVLAAAVSARWVEAPFLRLKDRLHPTRQSRHGITAIPAAELASAS